MLLKFLNIIGLTILALPATVIGECEPLVHREHVDVTCENPATKDRLDCYSRKLPTGTIGNYKCASSYYVPLNDDIDGGKLICNSRGRWIGSSQFLDFSCTVNCGIPPSRGATGFVIGGTATPPELSPWHASIFARRNSNEHFQYICGGTLIKPFTQGFVVLTAAHCLADSFGKARNTANVKVVLGGEFSSLEENEQVPDAQIHNVRQIVLHKSYGGSLQDFQADIAVMALAAVNLTNHVLPACFSGSLDEAEVGALGEIVGFGSLRHDSASLVLRNVTLPVVDPENCFEWRRRKLLPGEICAGYNNSQSVCNGDSGGGFMFQANGNGAKRYYIQGIVSHGKSDLANQVGTCDSYSVFTKVSSYAKWIRETALDILGDEDEEDELPPSTTEYITEAALPAVPATFPARGVPSPPPPPPEEPTTPETTRVATTPPTRTITKISESALITRVHRPQPVSQLQEYELKSLQRHNHYRRMHSASDFRLSSLMKQRAQAYADKLIREGTFGNENEKGINKNVYYVTGSRVKPEVAAVSAVDSWYEDIAAYNWDNPYYSTFSQIVWKETTDMGTGVATDGRRTIVVVAYYPPGNILGEDGRFFRENVSTKQT